MVSKLKIDQPKIETALLDTFEKEPIMFNENSLAYMPSFGDDQLPLTHGYGGGTARYVQHRKGMDRLRFASGFLHASGCPDKSLLAAVLARAFYDLADHSLYSDGSYSQKPKTTTLREDALLWFRSENSLANNHYFSFLYICEALDLNPEYILKAVDRVFLNPSLIPNPSHLQDSL